MESQNTLAKQLSCPFGENGIAISENMFATNKFIIEATLELLSIAENDALLELGPGLALHLNDLFVNQPNISYSALETSSLMVEKNAQHFTNNNQIEFYLYDGISIPQMDKKFNKIFTVNTLYFWQKTLELLHQLYQLLRPKGKLAITCMSVEYMQQLKFMTEDIFTLYAPEQVVAFLQNVFSPEHIHIHYNADSVNHKGHKIHRAFYTVVAEKL